jgi:hypothetical protein
VYTVPDQGTALLARIARPGSKTPPLVAGVSVPAPGESVCGDDFAFAQRAGGTAVLVVDGLGHGPLAADCATAAVDAFRENGGGSPPDAMRDIHGALRGTRGAAVAVGTIDWVHGEMRYCGIGNIAGMIWEHSRPRHLLSHPGIVGHDLRNVKDITYRLGENVLVLLYSDGISTHWSLDSYAGLHLHDPALIAGVIYRDHRRGRDDATVVVAKRPVES